jgi:hypothetical protein
VSCERSLLYFNRVLVSRIFRLLYYKVWKVLDKNYYASPALIALLFYSLRPVEWKYKNLNQLTPSSTNKLILPYITSPITVWLIGRNLIALVAEDFGIESWLNYAYQLITRYIHDRELFKTALPFWPDIWSIYSVNYHNSSTSGPNTVLSNHTLFYSTILFLHTMIIHHWLD